MPIAIRFRLDFTLFNYLFSLRAVVRFGICNESLESGFDPGTDTSHQELDTHVYVTGGIIVCCKGTCVPAGRYNP